jgi:hypothetical protein
LVHPEGGCVATPAVFPQIIPGDSGHGVHQLVAKRQQQIALFTQELLGKDRRVAQALETYRIPPVDGFFLPALAGPLGGSGVGL